MAKPTKDPNQRRVPRGSTLQFQQGWRACEAGQTESDQPYPTQPGFARDWLAGHRARAAIGFDTAHLPRKPGSDAFAL